MNSIRQAPDPYGSGDLSAAATRSETSWKPAPRHMRRLGNWLACLAVNQVLLGGVQVRSLPGAPDLASIAAMLRTLNPESKVRFLGEARMEVVRLDEDTVLKTAGG